VHTEKNPNYTHTHIRVLHYTHTQKPHTHTYINWFIWLLKPLLHDSYYMMIIDHFLIILLKLKQKIIKQTYDYKKLRKL